MKCNICPRKCNIERSDITSGFCQMPDELMVARAALHYWEEPCISGENGSGAIFFSGCNLKCIYCQNRDIALGKVGKKISVERFVEIMFELKDKGANNINLVTGAHYIDKIAEGLRIAKDKGLNIPVVYNTSSYEEADSIKKLSGLVDIYLPDMKYMDVRLAKDYSHAKDYTEKAMAAIDEMVKQTGEPLFDGDIMTRGVIVRHMVLPGAVNNAKKVIDYLLKTYGDKIHISIMNQYTPVSKDFIYNNLNRRVTVREYNKVVDYAIEKGLVNGFFQEGKTQDESFIPAFDYEGV